MARGIRPVERLESIVEQLDRALSERDVGELPRSGVLSPVDVDVVDDGDGVVVVADLPGFEKDDISVKSDAHRLRIEAEHREEDEVEDDSYYRRERSRERLSRTVPLPVEVDAVGADASYENGVLSVRLPKAEVEDGEEIEVS
ncbi:MAG: Hsp20/alpha crystallin family protein [Halobacteriales archaeon]